MKRWTWLIIGAVIFAAVLALLLSGCGTSPKQEARAAQALCNDHEGVREITADRYGYIAS